MRDVPWAKSGKWVCELSGDDVSLGCKVGKAWIGSGLGTVNMFLCAEHVESMVRGQMGLLRKCDHEGKKER
jgi:hypothetical protein